MIFNCVNISGRYEIPPGFETRIGPFMASFLPIFISLARLASVIALFLWLLRLTAQASLISAVPQLDLGEKVTIGVAISSGIGKLDKMVGINLLPYGPFFFLVMVLVGIGLVLGVAVLGSSLPGNDEGLFVIFAGSIALIVACIGLLFCVLLPLRFGHARIPEIR